MSPPPAAGEPPRATHAPLPWSSPGILVGTDGSEPSRAALEYAVGIAPKLGLPVHALAVWDRPAPLWGDAYIFYGEGIEDSEEEARALVTTEVHRLCPSGPPEWLTAGVWRGTSARMLVEASSDAAMLVVGNRGRGGFEGLLLGSVSRACARHAHCPVLVVRT